jgi:hypothetical protein
MRDSRSFLGFLRQCEFFRFERKFAALVLTEDLGGRIFAEGAQEGRDEGGHGEAHTYKDEDEADAERQQGAQPLENRAPGGLQRLSPEARR